jgi:hypothetical protein
MLYQVAFLLKKMLLVTYLYMGIRTQESFTKLDPTRIRIIQNG